MNNYKYFYYDTSEGKFKLKLRRRDYDLKREKFQIDYMLKNPEGEIIFKGDDFYIPQREINKHTANNLMGFLTLRPGDTDSDYFEDYTIMQWEFCNSFVCEELQSMITE